MVTQSQFISRFGDCSIPKVELSSLCTQFLDGDWIESKDQSDFGYRLVQTGNVGNGEYIDKSGRARFVSDDTFKRLNCTEIHPGDILFSRLPEPLGRCCILPGGFPKAITAVDCTIARLGEKCLSEFLVVYTFTELYSAQVNKCVTGTTRQRISRNNLAKILVPCPDLKEQQQFVQLARQADKSKFAGLKSQFIEILNSAEKRVAIEDVLSKVLKGKTPQYVEQSNVRVMNQACVHWDVIRWENVKYQDPRKLSNKEALKSFDILLNSTGTGTLGRCNIFFKPDDGYTYIPDGHLTVLNTNQDLMRPWLLVYFIKLEDIQREIYDDCVTGSTNQVDLVRKNFLKIRIPLPDMASQIRFDEIVEQADKSKYLN